MTQEQSIPMNYLISTLFAEDSLVKVFQLLENEKDLTTPEERYSLKLQELLGLKNLHFCFLKMFPDCFRMTKAGRLRQSSQRWMNWGMMSHGKCVTAQISVFPNPEKECSLLDFCEKKLKAKYLLSTKQILKLFSSASPVVKVDEFTVQKDLELHLQAVVEAEPEELDYTLCRLPIKAKTKCGYQYAYPGDSIDTAYSGKNSRRGRVGLELAHTLTTSPTQSIYFIDLNVDPKLTKIARCITARQDSGISNHKSEHSGVFVLVKEIDPNEITSLNDKIADDWIIENGKDKITALIITNSKGQSYLGYIKKLEPIECWRLQGFTDEQFNKVTDAGIKDGQLYKMAGNAVSVPVISALGTIIKNIWETKNNG